MCRNYISTSKTEGMNKGSYSDEFAKERGYDVTTYAVNVLLGAPDL